MDACTIDYEADHQRCVLRWNDDQSLEVDPILTRTVLPDLRDRSPPSSLPTGTVLRNPTTDEAVVIVDRVPTSEMLSVLYGELERHGLQTKPNGEAARSLWNQSHTSLTVRPPHPLDPMLGSGLVDTNNSWERLMAIAEEGAYIHHLWVIHRRLNVSIDFLKRNHRAGWCMLGRHTPLATFVGGCARAAGKIASRSDHPRICDGRQRCAVTRLGARIRELVDGTPSRISTRGLPHPSRL